MRTLREVAFEGNIAAVEHGTNGTHMECAYNALVATVRAQHSETQGERSSALSHLEAAHHALTLALREERRASGRDPETGARIPR